MQDLTPPGAPRWFESDHRTYDGDDPWFVVRFATAPAPAMAQKIMTALRTSPLGGPGSSPPAGRDLTLDFTDAGFDERGYQRFVRSLDALVAKLHAVAPVAFVFFQPDDGTLRLDDAMLSALLDAPEAAVARLSSGDAHERTQAALRADRLLGSDPERVVEMLAHKDTHDAARDAVWRYFLWGASGEESEGAREAALRALRLPAIEDLAGYGLGCALYRERDAPRCARTLARIAREPGLREPVARLLAGWRTQGLGTKTAGSEVVAALTLLREQGAHAEAIALARQALDRLKGKGDSVVEWITALLHGDQPSETKAKKAKARR